MADKPKILYISYNGLLEPILPSQAVPYLKGLAGKGYTFVLLTFEKSSGLKRVGRDGLRRIKDDLGSSGIEWVHLTYHKSPRLIATLYDLVVGSIRSLYIILARGVKIVHVRGITPGSIMLLLRRFVKVKVLFDMRGLLAEEIAAGGGWSEGGLAFRLVKKAEAALLKNSDAISVLTYKHLQLNKSLAVLNDRNVTMDTIPCCVDMEKFRYDPKGSEAYRQKLSIDKKFVLMYQGKIGTFYFMDEMVDFFKELKAARDGSIFFVVTNDPISPVMERASANGINNGDIKFVNGVGFEGMPQYLEAADAGIFFINPRNKLGSSPIKMGEFLASGVPVVINPGIGDTEEMVRDNRVGVVVKDFTKASYDMALDELFKLKSEGEVLRSRCRDTARKYLSLDMGIERYAALYEKLAGGPG